MKFVEASEDAVENKNNNMPDDNQEHSDATVSQSTDSKRQEKSSEDKEEPKKIIVNISRSELERQRLLSEDVDFVADSRAALLAKATPVAELTLYILGGFLVALIIWFSLANIDEATHGGGKVVPASQVQIIQNLEGGILRKIYVHEGEAVKKGQMLAKLDDVYFKSQHRERHNKYLALSARIARLAAESAGKKQIEFPSEVLEDPALVKHETNLFQSRQKTFAENMENMQESYQLASDELKITEPLVEQKVISQIELLRLRRELTAIETKLENYRNKYSEEIFNELIKARNGLATLQQDLVALKDRIERTSLYSPVDGIVKQIYLNTVGGVLKSAVPIMEVVPVDDRLVIEAKIAPSDIGFIKVGQKANVKISAYEYSIYGGLDGTVVRVSADTNLDKYGNSFYEVEIEIDKNYLGDKQGFFKIIPGMTASVDILTGKRTIMNYILKPVFRAKEKAMRER